MGGCLEKAAAGGNDATTSNPLGHGGLAVIVDGTPEAAAVDQDFALVMDADLAKNRYPAQKLEAARYTLPILNVFLLNRPLLCCVLLCLLAIGVKCHDSGRHCGPAATHADLRGGG